MAAMSVDKSQLVPGAVFRFKNADRRIVSIKINGRIEYVVWEYADNQKRGGKLGGTQATNYFRSDAIEQIADPVANSFRGKIQAIMPYDPVTKASYINAIGYSETECLVNLENIVDITEEVIERIKLVPVDISAAI